MPLSKQVLIGHEQTQAWLTAKGNAPSAMKLETAIAAHGRATNDLRTVIAAARRYEVILAAIHQAFEDNPPDWDLWVWGRKQIAELKAAGTLDLAQRM